MRSITWTIVIWAATAVHLAAATTTSGVAANPTSLSFSYTVNGTTLLTAQTVAVTATGTAATATLSAQATSTPTGWLAVVPNTGRAPLTLQVEVNPTGLSPGSYSGVITVDTVPTSNNPATVAVTLSVKNPPSKLNVPPTPISFSFTTADPAAAPASATINVASTGDTIPFSVTAGASTGSASSKTAVWARVNAANQTAALNTSGVALSGSSVPITVTVDTVTLFTLNPGSYTNVITVAANNAVNGSATLTATLVVSAGPPTVTSIFPANVVASPAVSQTITIYGANFFSTSVVTLQQTGTGAPPAVTLTTPLITRNLILATVLTTSLQTAGSFNIIVTNPPPPSNPAQAPAVTPFTVVSATQPAISAIVNSASYLPTATQTGTGPNPVGTGGSSVSPRELITIFGQNLGPTPAAPATATALNTGDPITYPTAVSGVTVNFQIPGVGAILAPLIMVSANQINAVVPVELATVVANAPPNNVVTVTVLNNGSITPAFTATAVPFDPGVFSLNGLGKGQAAVLNYDATSNSYLVNSSTAKAAKSSTIIIYATGLGDLSDATIANGQIAGTATTLVAGTTRVDIDGQPAVVSYAGSTPGAVAGLVQINAIVPPTVGSNGVSLTVSVGTAASARRSQQLVTIQVK